MNIEHKLRDIRADWAQRGFSFQYWIDPPGQVWRDFVHDVDELVVLVEGEIEIDVDGRRMRPRVGEEVMIPARARHTVSNVGQHASRWAFGYSKN